MTKTKKDFNDQQKSNPPVAKKENHEIEQFGEKRVDPYHWMRDPNWQEVLEKPDVLDPEIRQYLEAENDYTKAQFDTVEDLTNQIGDELVSRLIPNESSVPSKDGEWEYWSEYTEGADYPVYKRRHLSSKKEQVVLDENKEAKAHKFFDLTAMSHSPDQKYIAYAVDLEGSEYYNIYIREIETGKEFKQSIKQTTGNFVWGADSKTLYYTEADKHKRPKKIKSHKIGTNTTNDELVYHEKDDGFFLSVGKTSSDDYILIHCRDSQTSEVHFFDADTKGTPTIQTIHPREKGLEYNVHHNGDHFYIHTNADGATEFKLVKAPINNYQKSNWVDVIPADDKKCLQSVISLKNYLVRNEKENAMPRVIISDYDGKNEWTIDFPDPAYVIGASKGYEFDAHHIRVNYQTPANPGTTYEVDLKTKQKKVIKERKLPNGHNPDEYIVERFSVKADDGQDIPVTILRHKSTKTDGSSPLFQYGYGSYGAPTQPYFSSEATSIVDRGIIYAIAHIRGSSDKGEYWYKTGKLMTKKNTFTDFINVTERLIEKGYGKAGDVCMRGGSAGGMLMGAVANMRPDLYGSVLALVPFVDVLNTISDPTLPLTPPEWEEWGNPIKDKKAYQYMKSYSPYDNIRPDVTYPMIIAPAGLTDPRVTYWEPAKWIARLRDEAKGGPFLLKMNMGSGHFGSTARYDRVKEHADEYALCFQHWIDKGYDLSLRVDYPKAKNDQKKKPGNNP